MAKKRTEQQIRDDAASQTKQARQMAKDARQMADGAKKTRRNREDFSQAAARIVREATKE